MSWIWDKHPLIGAQGAEGSVDTAASSGSHNESPRLCRGMVADEYPIASKMFEQQIIDLECFLII